MASNATLPTTRMPIELSSSVILSSAEREGSVASSDGSFAVCAAQDDTLISFDVATDDRREIVLHLLRNQRAVGDDRVLQGARTRAIARPLRDARHGGAKDLLRHRGIRAQ